MNALNLLLFMGGCFVVGFLVMFGWSLLHGSFDRVDQASLLPMQEDVIVEEKSV